MEEPDQDGEYNPEEAKPGDAAEPETQQVMENAIMTQVSKSQRKTPGGDRDRECWNCFKFSTHYAFSCDR